MSFSRKDAETQRGIISKVKLVKLKKGDKRTTFYIIQI